MKITSEHEQQNKVIVDNIRIRTSSFFLIAKLVLLNFIFIIALIALRALLLFLFPNTSIVEILEVYVVVYGVLGLSVSAITLYVVLSWKNRYYDIKPSSIISHKGIVVKQVINFACNRIESISVHVSAVGSLFNFGTVSLYDPFLEKYIHLVNISNPRQVAKTLNQIYILPNSKRP